MEARRTICGETVRVTHTLTQLFHTLVMSLRVPELQPECKIGRKICCGGDPYLQGEGRHRFKCVDRPPADREGCWIGGERK